MTGSRSITIAACLLLSLFLGPALRGAEISADVEPRSLREDGTLLLRLTVEGRDLGDVAPPSLSRLEDWTVVNGPSVSTQFRYVNGVSSSSRTFTWVLSPQRAGDLTIPSLQVTAEGASLASKPLSVKVRPAAAPGTAGDAGGEVADVFVRATVEPQDPFVSQRLLLEYHLYTRVEVASLPQLQEVPDYPGFWSEELEIPQSVSGRREAVGGQEYTVFTVRRVALIPTASGPTEIPAVTFSVPVRSRGRSRFRRSFFFDPVETVYARTVALPVAVRPLPREGRPESFSNGVGAFDLEVKPDRTAARTGEAVSVTVSVEGSGNLNSVRPPEMDGGDAFTIYPPELRAEASGPRGSRRTWEYILIPRRPGRLTLPEVEFAYFDTERETYRTLQGPGASLQVEGEPLPSVAVNMPARRTLQRLGADIHHIREDLSLPPGPPLHRTTWFWAALLLPTLANGGALALRLGRRRMHGRAGLTRQRRAARAARRRLARAAMEMEAGPQAFHREVSAALTGYVADKCGRPAAGLTYDTMASILRERDVPESTAGEILDVIATCDAARFAPQAGAVAQRQEMLARARKSLDQLAGHL